MAMGSGGSPIFSLIWLLILIFLSFWIAGIAAGLYVIVYCIEACVPDIKVLSEILLKGVQFPHYCAKQMLDGAPLG
jgi:hypothetical protein